MGPVDEYNITALINAFPVLGSQSATGGTAITTAAIMDRGGVQYARSMCLVLQGTYTAASGASGDYLTISGTVNSSTASNMASPTALKTFSVQAPWVSNAANKQWIALIPLNFNGANEYIQLSSLTLTPTTVGTYSALTVSALAILGGSYTKPVTAYNTTGFLAYNA